MELTNLKKSDILFDGNFEGIKNGRSNAQCSAECFCGDNDCECSNCWTYCYNVAMEKWEAC